MSCRYVRRVAWSYARVEASRGSLGRSVSLIARRHELPLYSGHGGAHKGTISTIEGVGTLVIKSKNGDQDGASRHVLHGTLIRRARGVRARMN